MKLLKLKFIYGVEIGAHLAYLGHFKRTKNIDILRIAHDENLHKKQIKEILKTYNTEPNIFINFSFFIVGNIVRYLCLISPKKLLNKIARFLEIFAVFSYGSLAKDFPKYADVLLEMQKTEQDHAEYFKA